MTETEPISFKDKILAELRLLVQMKPTTRSWQIALLAALSVGIPLFIGLALDNIEYGMTASLPGLLILYMPSTSFLHRMITVLTCAFGLMFSYMIGVIVSYNPWAFIVLFAAYAMCMNWVVNYVNLPPPRNFFFIYMASMASFLPFDINTIPIKIGLISMGSMLVCTVAFAYNLLIVRQIPDFTESLKLNKNHDANIVESAIIGFFVGLSMLASLLLGLHNPYWVPISCAAVMQGGNLSLIWQRSFQRIAGTVVGLGVCWILLQVPMNPWVICTIVFVLQLIVEMIVTRNYALAVVFITPLAIMMAEAKGLAGITPTELIKARFLEIALGSIIGAVGGYIVHNKQIRDRGELQLRLTRRKLHDL